MFSFFRKTPKLPSDQKLKKIQDILFPVLDKRVDSDGNKFAIDKSVDINLNAVLNDLLDGHNDEACHNTLKNAIKDLSAARQILEAHNILDNDIAYFIVDNRRYDDDYIENIQEKIL